MDNTKNKDTWRLPVIILLCLMLICTWFLYYQSQYVRVDIEKLKESVVIINSCDNYGVHQAAGSGVISYQNNEIITCYHVINGDVPEFEVLLNDGTTVKVDSIIAYNEELDIAVLHLEEEVNAKPLNVTAHTMKPGDEVFTISSPDGELNVVSEGRYKKTSVIEQVDYIVTTAKVSPGSSGGALFDRNGNLIGIICKVDNNFNSFAVSALKTDDVLKNNRVECTMEDFYSARKVREPIILSVAELLNDREEYDKENIIVYGLIQNVDEGTILVTADAGETEPLLTIDLRGVSDTIDLKPGKAIQARGLFINATKNPILYANILEIRD